MNQLENTIVGIVTQIVHRIKADVATLLDQSFT